MNLEEQKLWLNYCFTEAPTSLVKQLPPHLFDSPITGVTFGLLQEFIINFKVKPKAFSWRSYVTEHERIPDDLAPDLVEEGIEALQPFPEASDFYLAKTKKLVKEQLVSKALLDMAEKEGDTDYATKRAGQLIFELDTIEMTEDVIRYKLTDANFTDFAQFPVTPSPFNNLNKLTEDGGFSAPQMIVIAAPFKSNKTTFLVNLAYGYATRGCNVLLVDTENGQRNLRKRLRQRVSEATSYEWANNIKLENGLLAQDLFDNAMATVRRNKGDIHFMTVPVKSVGLDAVESEINRLASEGIKIDCIVYEYIEQLKCGDPKIREDNKQIQWLYLEAIKLNQKYNLFSFTPSHINREGVKALKLGNMGGEYISGDIGKLNNAHAVFLLEPKELENGDKVLFLHVMAQREGKAHGTICFTLDMGIQKITELIPIDE